MLTWYQPNTVAVESRRAANNTLLTAEDTALQARIAANTLVAASNDFCNVYTLKC